MVVRRRATFSKTLFENPAQQKPTEPEVENPEHSVNSVTSISESSSGTSRSRDSVRRFLRRSRSKLLSMLRLRSNCSGTGEKMTLPRQPEHSSQKVRAGYDQGASGRVVTYPLAHRGNRDADGIPGILLAPSRPLKRLCDPTSYHNRGKRCTSKHHSEDGHQAIEVENLGCKPSTLHVPRRHSSPGFTNILSRRFSATFGHPTVIHRSDLRRRPSIHSFSFTPPASNTPDLRTLGDNAQDDTDSSSVHSASSPRTQSTNLLLTGSPPGKVGQIARKLGRVSLWLDTNVSKVLGKGSFGVVRLVREKHTGDIVETPKPESYATQSHRRPSTFDALKSAVDGARSSRRKDLDRSKKDVFAMKVIRKSDMIRNCQEGHLRAERDFLVASTKSRWIVPLVASFQDTHSLYLVMDYMVGGDFLSLLIRKNILSEDVTRWYIAEMILCVEETHRLRWIHRDVKPDNFLISASGHLKISDFGLAFDGHWSHDQTYYMNQRQSLMSKLGIQVEGDDKDRKAAQEVAHSTGTELPRRESGKNHDRLLSIPSPGPNDDILCWRNRKQRKKLARSVVGTSQYMAPEVIRGEFYDGRCDWWSIGIILYECLYGFTPFAAKTRHDTKQRILHHYQTLYFPTDRPSDHLISDDAIDLIIQILQEKEYRLCSEKYILNDYVHSGRIPGELLNYPADKTSRNYRGHYVYPDDAADIKNHPFFKAVRWDELHYRSPPFVPKVKAGDDTKYFEGEQVSDAPDGPSEASLEEVDGSRGQTPNNSGKTQLDGPSVGCKTAVNLQSKSLKKKREKKRARDKVLRDDRDIAIGALKMLYLPLNLKGAEGSSGLTSRVQELALYHWKSDIHLYLRLLVRANTLVMFIPAAFPEP
ncbi:serine/threonine-protein kinase CBK1 [Coccidioides immitis H538.4]|uniref:non-specific serine/threonine protein kinase n=1 Tax=Coccidioides immitis H538.4 TaxID=396776 RepID=A0A0J8RHP3_COCIT|nr:serine/threonine-protein kinase CBK1 [Coccidioides immitis H538.4]